MEIDKDKCDKALGKVIGLLAKQQWTHQEMVYICGSVNIDIGASIEKLGTKINLEKFTKKYFTSRDHTIGQQLIMNGVQIIDTLKEETKDDRKEEGV